MAVWTNTGITLAATTLQTPGATAGIAWVDISQGCGTLSVALSSGGNYTALTMNAGIPVALGSGQSLTITDGVHTQTVTTSASVLANATSIPVNGFTPVANFAANTTGVAPTPAATDAALYNGLRPPTVRVAANQGSAGANPGESLDSGFFDGTQATGIYMLVGYFGGPTATSVIGTGTLMIEDIQYWNHVVNNDSNMFQADSTI